MTIAAIAAFGALSLVLVLLRRSRSESRRLGARLEEALANLQRLEGIFARMVPHELVERVIGGDHATVGQKREVTVLFADLVGFTGLSESLEASVLVRVLNGYFDRMTRAIVEHRGRVSTFLGDGLLALFGAFEPNPWQSDDALHAALAMRGELGAYNRELEAEGLPRLGFGVGVHRGVGVAGLVGSHERLEFAVVGGVVNVAARVQSLTRSCDADILATREVRELADSRFLLRELPPAELRGLRRPVQTFALEGFQGGDA